MPIWISTHHFQNCEKGRKVQLSVLPTFQSSQSSVFTFARSLRSVPVSPVRTTTFFPSCRPNLLYQSVYICNHIANEQLSVNTHITPQCHNHIQTFVWKNVQKKQEKTASKILWLPVVPKVPVGWQTHIGHQHSGRTSGARQTLHRWSFHFPWEPQQTHCHHCYTQHWTLQCVKVFIRCFWSKSLGLLPLETLWKHRNTMRTQFENKASSLHLLQHWALDQMSK